MTYIGVCKKNKYNKTSSAKHKIHAKKANTTRNIFLIYYWKKMFLMWFVFTNRGKKFVELGIISKRPLYWN